MDKEVKWLMMPLVALALAMGIVAASLAVEKALEHKYAMENGYEEVIETDENGFKYILWKKDK